VSSGPDFTDVATGHEYVTLLIKKLSDTATVKYDTVDHEFSTVGYPVFETPLQDLINAYQRASQQLSTLQKGRYAYAQDWNVLADYAKAIINVLVDQLNRLIARGNRRYVRAYDMLLECHRILSTYKYLKTGNVIMPEHTNTLIDVAKCLDLAVRLLLRKAIVKHNEVDVATSLEMGRLLPLIILVDPDDWETASKWITDGTIIFVNYGITTMTPDEVYNIVNNRAVAFVVMIDTQPRRGVSAGAFYGVLYTHPNPSRCRRADYVELDRSHHYIGGFVECFGSWWPRPIDDDIVDNTQKVPNAVEYIRYAIPHDPVKNCGYVYVKYEKGGIIEAPYDDVWYDLIRLEWYIGVIAYMLIREPVSCFLAYQATKLNRIIWMANYGTRSPSWYDDEYSCSSVEHCIRKLSDLSGWPVFDLRKHHP